MTSSSSTLAVGLGDVPVIVLVLGVLVLCATTVVTAFNLPGRRWGRHGWVIERRQHRRRATDRRARHDGTDGVLTTATVRLAGPTDHRSAIALPPTTAGLDQLDHLDDPEAVIAHLLDTDPQLLARVMSDWIRDDDARPTPADPEPGAP